MARQSALTTKDNPFDPFTQWDQWYMFDVNKGYYTCNYLARIAHTNDELSDMENEIRIDNAIEEILETNPLNIYKRVYEGEMKPSNNSKP